MIIPKIFLVFVLAICFTSIALSQTQQYKSIGEAIQASKTSKKPLIIFRINTVKINFDPGYNPKTIGLLDSVIHSSVFKESIKKEYLIYPYNENESNDNDKLYLNLRFLDDHSPNMIVLNEKEECIAYSSLTPEILQSDFVTFAQSKIRDLEAHVKIIQTLEPKFKSKQITNAEIQELIKSRYQLRKTSLKHWNSFAADKENIPLTAEFNLLTQEAFSPEDSFFKFLMSADSEYADLKIRLLQNVKDRVLKEVNVEKYQTLRSAVDSIRNLTLYGKSNPIKTTKSLSPAEKMYEDAETMKLIELFTAAGDESLLIKTATMFARNIISNPIPASDKPVIIAKSDSHDLFGKVIVTNQEGDTVKVKSSDEMNAPGAKILYASYLSHIAWSFATVVQNKTNLLEAIVWCKKSIEWNSTKENNHAIAHLYFATGKPQKAIEHQKKAISIAISEGLTQNQVQYFRDALLKFEAE